MRMRMVAGCAYMRRATSASASHHGVVRQAGPHHTSAAVAATARALPTRAAGARLGGPGARPQHQQPAHAARPGAPRAQVRLPTQAAQDLPPASSVQQGIRVSICVAQRRTRLKEPNVC